MALRIWHIKTICLIVWYLKSMAYFVLNMTVTQNILYKAIAHSLYFLYETMFMYMHGVYRIPAHSWNWNYSIIPKRLSLRRQMAQSVTCPWERQTRSFSRQDVDGLIPTRAKTKDQQQLNRLYLFHCIKGFGRVFKRLINFMTSGDNGSYVDRLDLVLILSNQPIFGNKLTAKIPCTDFLIRFFFKHVLQICHKLKRQKKNEKIGQVKGNIF